MKSFNNKLRSPFLNIVRRAFYLSNESAKKDIPIKELLEMSNEYSTSRRKMLKNMAKGGLLLGSTNLLNACTKTNDFEGNRAINSSGISQSFNGTQPKIVIVGAGLAGLNCAYQLNKSGYSSTIYEASERTGGRIFSKTNLMGTGLFTELGGEFIDSQHTDLLQLCSELGLSLLDMGSPTEAQLSNETFFVDGQLYTESQINEAYQPYSAQIAADARSLPAIISYNQYNDAALKFDKMSIKSYFDSIGMTGWFRKGLEAAYLTEYGRETDDQSAINFLYLFAPKNNQSFEIFGTSDERYHINGGNQKLTDALSQRLANQIIYRNQLVQINPETSGYSLYFTNVNNATVKISADIVIITIPFTTLRNVKINVPMPTVKTQSIQTLGYGTNSKLFLGFNSRTWRQYNNTGYIFTNGSMQTGWDSSWIQPGAAGSYTVFQGGNRGIALGTGSPQFHANPFVAQLEQIWAGSAAAYNGNVQRMHWPTSAFALGSYSCYRVNQFTTIGGVEKMPVGNIYFAGEHCSFNYQGYMNGAAETGRKTATEVAAAIRTARF